MADRKRVAVLISGRGSNFKALLDAQSAADCPYEIALVVSNVEDAAGLDIARAAGVATFAKSHKGLKRAEFDALVDAELRAHDIEAVALAGYMRLLSPGFVEGWAGRMVNIHPSLLPLYKGLDTHARAIEAGDAKHGCSVHLVTAGLDEGPVLAQAEVPILPGDTPDTLAARVLVEEHRLYPLALAELVRTL
ncbi:phosphoribosylglycinamide formyltransferase [Sphingomonas oligoaromativorans]|jgi:formyltetrahydrofolate-dependent phosphoribosylglycinamide formyltransferase|uniref:phosphoribosylglycinamide formyltransferase n=1 Tax=Sphingomonas oligoaromativorans TaxID=575322 RepID=UPI0014219A07|nr:formyltetrahydrofolate-dependent phosphoribosylglycinamide formyltransferase [Sphingomonas oligoaromativorans]